MRILIADDDPHTRSLLESMLIRWGYDVVVTENGKEALEILQWDDPPPLAILDRMMPGIDGVTLCRKVRENPGARPNYLILLTGMSDQRDIVEGLRAGADDYVTKSFNETGIFTVTLIRVAHRVERSLQATPCPQRKASLLLGPVSLVDRL